MNVWYKYISVLAKAKGMRQKNGSERVKGKSFPSGKCENAKSVNKKR